MCGIWAIFGLQDNYHHCGTSFTKITHRGPDAWRVEYDKRVQVILILFYLSLYRNNVFVFQLVELQYLVKTLLAVYIRYDMFFPFFDLRQTITLKQIASYKLSHLNLKFCYQEVNLITVILTIIFIYVLPKSVL